MNVLIKNMEMPTNCADCPLNYDQMACGVTGTRWWSDSMVLLNFESDKERLQDCPLTEIPTPHGRLIDADEFKNYIRSGYEEMKHLFNENLKTATLVTEGFCKDIDEAPTVIEAEE